MGLYHHPNFGSRTEDLEWLRPFGDHFRFPNLGVLVFFDTYPVFCEGHHPFCNRSSWREAHCMPPVLVASPAGTRVQKQPLRTAESFGNQLFSGSRNLKQNHLAVEYQGRQDQLTAEIEWIQNRTANCTHMIYMCVCWGALWSGPSGLWIDRNGRMAKAKHLFLAPNILRLVGFSPSSANFGVWFIWAESKTPQTQPFQDWLRTAFPFWVYLIVNITRSVHNHHFSMEICMCIYI